MLNYLESSKVTSIFPVSFPRKVYPNNNLLSEANLTNIIKVMSGHNSTVFSTSEDRKLVNGTNFEFLIDGYYFSFIFNSEDFVQFSGDVYAVIFIDCSNTNYPLLYGFDDEEGTKSKFYGIVFTDDPETVDVPTTLSTYKKEYLKILSNVDNAFFIPDEYVVKDDIVDGGEID